MLNYQRVYSDIIIYLREISQRSGCSMHFSGLQYPQSKARSYGPPQGIPGLMVKPREKPGAGPKFRGRLYRDHQSTEDHWIIYIYITATVLLMNLLIKGTAIKSIYKQSPKVHGNWWQCICSLVSFSSYVSDSNVQTQAQGHSPFGFDKTWCHAW